MHQEAILVLSLLSEALQAVLAPTKILVRQ